MGILAVPADGGRCPSALQNTLGSLLKGAVGEQTMEKVGTFLDKLQKELQK